MYPNLYTFLVTFHSIKIIDSHTAGEPTRTVLSGMPDLGNGPLSDRLNLLRTQHDHYRHAILCEPRGSDVLVGAYILPPHDPRSAASVIFFNNAGYLGMCGHGMIGVAVTLAHLNLIQPGEHWLDTPVGPVQIQLHSPNDVTIHNVSANRYLAGISVEVPGYGKVLGDVAWGGNWFFLVREHNYSVAQELTLRHIDSLTNFTWAIRQALTASAITGANNAEIDHIEIFSAPHNPSNQSRNFVLCPGKAYDRSPCGTGTSAKMACLAADGLLQSGDIWRQEGILGTVFEGSYQSVPNNSNLIAPTIRGTAYVTAESTQLFDPADPFKFGIPE